jgi:predicted metal-dependent hydrolase
MSYDRMKEKERQIRAEVRALLAQAEATDAAEDAQSGAEQRGDELPEELQRRETRLKKIREAKRALEERARQKAEAEGKPAEESETGQARRQGSVQFHGSGVAPHEGWRWLRSRLECAGGSRAGIAVDRGAERDTGGQR